MTYSVVQKFRDFKDLEAKQLHTYEVGDSYPREGYKPEEERINELLANDNEGRHELLKGKPIIEEVAEKAEPENPPVDLEEDPEAIEQSVDGPFPIHTGGGYYELSDGSKVQGKEAAATAQKALNVEE